MQEYFLNYADYKKTNHIDVHGPKVITIVSLKKKSHKTKPRDMIHLEKLKNIPGILILRNAFISPIS